MFKTELQGSIFTLKTGEIGEDKRQPCQLRNEKLNTTYEFTYRKPTLFKKFPGYRIESDWSGTARDLFSIIIPKLEQLHKTLQPISEKFDSYPDATESSYRDTDYCNEYQTTRYTCQFHHNTPTETQTVELTLNFGSIVMKDYWFRIPGEENLYPDKLQPIETLVKDLVEKL